MTAEDARKYFKDGYWFTGERCSKCESTVNLLKCSATHGFFCERCGEYTPVVWNCNTIPHSTPDFGPSQQILDDAKTEATK